MRAHEGIFAIFFIFLLSISGLFTNLLAFQLFFLPSPFFFSSLGRWLAILHDSALVHLELLRERGLLGLEPDLVAVGGLDLLLEGLVLLLEEGRSQRDLVLLQPAGLARPPGGEVVLQPLLPIFVVLTL